MKAIDYNKSLYNANILVTNINFLILSILKLNINVRKVKKCENLFTTQQFLNLFTKLLTLKLFYSLFIKPLMITNIGLPELHF